MDWLTVLLFLVVIAVLLFLFNKYVPAPQIVKTIVNCVVLFIALLWCLQQFGVLPRNTIIHFK